MSNVKALCKRGLYFNLTNDASNEKELKRHCRIKSDYCMVSVNFRAIANYRIERVVNEIFLHGEKVSVPRFGSHTTLSS